MRDPFFDTLISAHDAGQPRGIASVCSAHPLVLEAALLRAARVGGPVLIEATCNQVNQDGGYTGMRPADFHAQVLTLVDRVGLAHEQLIFGGDHLGPNPWKQLPADAAMEKAGSMVAAYVDAGFTKIHLDTSMSCADDPTPLPTQTIAKRAASLAAVAERHSGGRTLAYVIGTEVPVPGGATEHVDELVPTTPADAEQTVEEHREAFDAAGIAEAFGKVVGLVVQPGVEFGHDNVVLYEPGPARGLIAARPQLGILFEAHSTDYQSEDALQALVRDGFGILKVGPWLTFALREALYSLDHISEELTGTSGLQAGMEALMLREPGHWERYYPGDDLTQRLLRHYSYSDRIRYYWTTPEAKQLVTDLMDRLADRDIPETLISQYLPELWPEVVAGHVAPQPRALLLAAVDRVLGIYAAAIAPA
ncbi:D-tagatose-bisphosphate aldolase, class II, non-catalytic subunit [Devosia pacifica]|uniref:D-tagatose-bisphosphate aldolase, class II, non-catalytic subunit n=1 Tax=Devosia pacifica TaxID=1335967 RepID=A0A918VX29_9HYPH|nr:D-tagatose-bisphosphate aldolase, class II, non-catalytic subunit [Devosia pacifica]GHA33173.1 D-tagatose-bisphosphate aldolase, class II, non-catalytic subunit [Devosia pacifica]